MDGILHRMSMMEDQGRALAYGLRQRDPAVLDALVEQYQYRLLRYLIHLTANRATAEDLFQETWLRVLERGHQYNGRNRFESWLFAIARHLFLDRIRSKAEAARSDTDDVFAQEIPGQHAVSPFDLYRQHQQQETMAHLVAQLPMVYREVLALRFQEELPLEEIAAILGAPLSTVKSRLYRALAQLQERMTLPGRKEEQA